MLRFSQAIRSFSKSVLPFTSRNISQPDSDGRRRPVTLRSVNCIEAIAAYLATEPPAVRLALRAHRRAVDGRCTTCGGIARWPCAVAAGAMLARDLIDDRAAPVPD